MKELNSAPMGTSSGAICKLPRPVDFPRGRGCARIRAEAIVTMQNSTAGALDYTGARAKALIEGLFKTSTLKFGDRAQDVVDTALDFDELQRMLIAMTGDDVLIVNPTTGAPIRYRDLAAATVLSAAVAAGASITLTVEIARAFELPRLGSDAYAFCPGATQMGQIQWEFIRGTTVDTNGNFVQNGVANILFVVDDFEASDDPWASVVRVYNQDENGRVSHGPKGPIGLISLWERTSIGSATALTLFSVERDGDTAIHDNANAARQVRDALYTDPIGAYDLNALATVLVQIPDGAELHDIPCGSGFRLGQTGSELNPPQTVWLHIPARNEAEIDELVGKNVETADGVKLIGASAKTRGGVSGPVASLLPVLVVPRGAADFESLPGRVYAKNQAAVTHVPSHVIGAARAQTAAGGDSETVAANASRVANAIAKVVPGAASAVRGKRSPWFQGLRARLAGK